MTGTTSLTVESRIFAISEFFGKSDNAPKAKVVSWNDLCDEIKNPLVRREKDGPLISPASFKPKTTRANENVESVSMLGFDADHNCDFEGTKAAAASLGCSFAVHSTHSHRLVTENNPGAEPRFRILIPLATDLPKDQFAGVYNCVKRRLGLPVDEAPKAAAQMFYKPVRSSLGVPYVSHIEPGSFLDWQALPIAAEAPAPKPQAEPIASVVTNGNRNTTLMSLGGTLRRRNVAPATILATLLSTNEAQFDSPLAKTEVEKVFNNLLKYEPDTGLNSLNSLNSQPKKAQRVKPVLDSAALYGPVGAAVRIMEPHTEAAEVAILIQILAAFGVMIGRGPHFRFGSSIHYTKINTVLVGPSGKGRKGTAWSDAMAFLSRVDEGFKSILASGLSSGEGLIHHVRDPLFKETPIKKDGRIVEYQKEMVDAGSLDKRAFFQESEFSRVLKAAGREGSTLSEVIRDGFDKDFLSVLTKSGIRATDVQIAFAAHITENEVRRELDDTAMANGFANRIIWIYTERSRSLPFGGNLNPADLNGAVQDVQRAYEFARTVGQMKRTALADGLWCENYERLSDGDDSLLDALIARGTAHVMRLACIYALLDRTEYIDLQHLQAALALWQYAEDTVRYIWGGSLGDRTADAILNALSERPDGMTRTDISNFLGRHASGAKISGAIDRLDRLGRIRGDKYIGEKGGAPVTRFFLVNAK